MNRIIAIALLALSGVVSGGSALAQEHGVRATIPFDFAIGNNVLPAGHYQIVVQDHNLVQVRNRDYGTTSWVVALPGDLGGGNDGKLLFDKYGDQYFLISASSSSANLSIVIPPSRMEKQLRDREARVSTPERTLIALK